MISLIMSAKNVGSYVGDTVEELNKASYTDWELVVIEDHSTDNTLDILKGVEKKDPRIKVFLNRGRDSFRTITNAH